jgi:hypothetical protein
VGLGCSISFFVMKIYTRFTLLLFSLFGWVSSYAAEQDNWYIAWEVDVPGCSGVAYHVDQTSGVGQIYVVHDNIVSVMNNAGVLSRTINVNLPGSTNKLLDLAIDHNGTLYLSDLYGINSVSNGGNLNWRQGSNTYSSDLGKFREAKGIAIGPNNKIFVADYNNHRIQVFDENGIYQYSFGESGVAPGQLKAPEDLAFLTNDSLIVATYGYGDASEFLHYFHIDGSFIKRENVGGGSWRVSIAKDDTIFSRSYLRNSDSLMLSYLPIDPKSRTCFTPEGDLIESYDGKLRLWKRAFRTKGLPERNIIAQPAIRSVSQRAGTNIIDIDVEIIDADDSNVTLGVLAAIDGEFNNPNKWILPQNWVDESETKVGRPISTNELHRLSWDVKQDWAQPMGTLQFEVLAQTGSRTKPIDVHYIVLSLAEGNMTISRSPIMDLEMVNYFKYLLVTGQSDIILYEGKIVNSTGHTLVESDNHPLASSLFVTPLGRSFFIDTLGYRWATLAEVQLARLANTPGSVNDWLPEKQILPRGLPGKVNEFGFDVGEYDGRAWWVIKESSVPALSYKISDLDHNSSENSGFGNQVAIGGQYAAVSTGENTVNIYGDSNLQKRVYFEISGGYEEPPFYNYRARLLDNNDTLIFVDYAKQETVKSLTSSSGEVFTYTCKVSPEGSGIIEIGWFQEGFNNEPDRVNFTVEAVAGWRFAGFADGLDEFSVENGSSWGNRLDYSIEKTAIQGTVTALFEPIVEDSVLVDISTFEFLPGYEYAFVTEDNINESHPFMVGENAGDINSNLVKGGAISGRDFNILMLDIPYDFQGELYSYSTENLSRQQKLKIGSPAKNKLSELSLKYELNPRSSEWGSPIVDVNFSNFGNSLKILDWFLEDIIVGAPLADIAHTRESAKITKAGAVAVTTLGQEDPYLDWVVASDAGENDKFGASTAMAFHGVESYNRGFGLSLLVGAPMDDHGDLQNAGSAYLFAEDRNYTNGRFNEVAKIVANGGGSDDQFGYAVAIDDTFIAIGAPFADSQVDGFNLNDSGKVYLYDYNENGNVSHLETLEAPYIHSGSFFGQSLSLSNGFLVVGSPGNDYDINGANFTDNQGAVSVYQLSSDGPAELISFRQSPNAGVDGKFGYSLDCKDGFLVVGAVSENSLAANKTGVAHLYEFSNDGELILLNSFFNPLSKSSDRYGASVSVSESGVLIGADHFDLPDGRVDSGQAIFYGFSE